ncbi:hypothetical protein FIE12Z_1220 [Fusarium flagelliforme]|uniref:Uncharacterized protein n=1 Tax=Fusarium flagelliforme TaxID=2675880 RepID=A0A395N2S7_9HYPO|nr:hypothetical protein FIE12Z_1220 [Fusarium flagelliforme]
MGPRSTTSTAKTTISAPTKHEFYQDPEPSKSTDRHTTSNSSSSNRQKRKRKTTNNVTSDKTTFTSGVHSHSKDYPDLSTTEGSNVALTASTPSRAMQTQGPNLIDTGGQHSTESKLDLADDETVVRIRQDLIRLGIELRENARTQIRWIGQVEDLDRSHRAIDADPFSTRD